MGAIASQITSLTIVYSTVYSDAVQRKHQSSAPLAFVREIHHGPVNFPHKWPVTRKMFPFDDVIMNYYIWYLVWFQGKCAISYHIFSDCYLQHFSQNSCVVLYPTKPYWRYVVTWYWLLTIRQATGHNLNPSWPSSVNQWPTADHVRYYQFYSLHINNVNVWYILNAVFMDSVISYKYNTLVLTRCGLVTIYIYIYIYIWLPAPCQCC